MKTECLELVTWSPRRKHAKNRNPIAKKVVGITNKDYCLGVYWAIAEVDTKNISLEEYISRLRRKDMPPLMIFETIKGYHFYLDYYDRNPLKVYHRLMKLKMFDKGHLKLAKTRVDEFPYTLILRISPKYHYGDILPVWVNPTQPLPKWHREVLRILTMFQTGLLSYE